MDQDLVHKETIIWNKPALTITLLKALEEYFVISKLSHTLT